MSLIPSFFLSLTCGLFTSSFFPIRSFRYLLCFSTLTSGSFTSSFRFEPFISLYFFPLVSSLTSASFTSSFPLTRPFHRVRPFVATLRFDSLLLSLSFQLFAPVPYTSFLSF